MMEQPLLLQRPAVQSAPLVLTSPHSGQNYPADFLAASRLDSMAIRRSEDSFVDQLFGAGPALGVPLLAANFPRAYCDVNREAWELDPGMFEDALPGFVNATSPRVTAGLGTIARIVGTGEPIYRGKMRFAEAQARVQQCWEPYHAALRGLIAETLSGFGACLVLDCHSMPSAPAPRGGKLPEVVLGDVHGTSCAPQVTAFVDRKLSQLGLNLRRNDPYAGGFITRHYGRPRDGVHVLQIEFLRSLYMEEAALARHDGFGSLARKLSAFLAAMVEVTGALLPSRDRGVPNAAE